MIDIPRMHYVTDHYPQLQGLRLVLLGVPFLASAAWRAGLLAWWPSTAGRGAQLWFFAGLAVAIVGSYPIRAHYHRRWGWIRPPRRGTGATALITFAVCVAVLVLRQPDRLPVSLPVIFVGLQMLYLGVVDGGIRKHYRVIACGCFVFASLPVVGVSAHTRSIALDLLTGAGLITAGWGDHVLLRSVFEQLEGAWHVGAQHGSVHPGPAGA